MAELACCIAEDELQRKRLKLQDLEENLESAKTVEELTEALCNAKELSEWRRDVVESSGRRRRQWLEERHVARLKAAEDAAALHAAARDGCAELPEFAQTVQRFEQRLPQLSDAEASDWNEAQPRALHLFISFHLFSLSFSLKDFSNFKLQ